MDHKTHEVEGSAPSGGHYVCTGGCGGRSDNPGSCQAPSCADYQKTLKQCHCTDGGHKEVHD